ncbi:general substrate transporter [Xylariaceae sp. FL0804]|nr:general substrate transporter [Xylariaceae sp. FL0804]
MRGDTLNYAIGFIAGCDFLLFGYDQGVMGGILTMPSFLDLFPSINPDADGISNAESAARSTNQGIAVACYNLGCFLGAILTIFISNPLGRRRMIILGTSIMVVGAILQASATTLPHFIIGRIITGVGNGGNTSTVPTWQSETSQSHKRGRLVMIEGALIVGGIMLSNWIDLGLSFAPGSVAWRFPMAFQCAFCLVILALVPHLPESPRWLVLKGRDDEARRVLAALVDRPVDDRFVRNELASIRETVLEASKGSFRDLFTMGKDRNFHRALLAYVNQMFQQITGCNLITYYAPVICQGLGMSDFMSLVISSCIATQYFIVTWPPVFLVERVGRRKLMLFGAAGQAVTMAILAGVNSSDTQGCRIAAIVFLFYVSTSFQLGAPQIAPPSYLVSTESSGRSAGGLVGMTWLYPAEIVPLRIRAPANALSTSANWIFNFLVVMITPVAFNRIGYQTYIIFAAINAAMVPSVYFFYPETAYRSLEEMDAIFHRVGGDNEGDDQGGNKGGKGKGLRPFLAVVQAARDEPLHYGRHGELLIEHGDPDAARKVEDGEEGQVLGVEKVDP